MRDTLEVLVQLSICAGTWLLVALIARFLKQTSAQNVYTSTTSTSEVATAVAAPAPPARTKAPKVIKEPPGLSCGHCGARNPGDPVKAVVLETTSYRVYVCPTCKGETLLPDKS
jgi:hypothetical protein